MVDLARAAVLLTGATSGIGRATARLLAPRVGRLLVHGPEPHDAAAGLIAELRPLARDGSRVEYLRADYTNLADVARLAADAAARADRLALVINNAARPGPRTRTITADGNELTLQVDYLAAVAITGVIATRMPADARWRVVNVASATHLTAQLDLDDLQMRRGYSAVAAYARAKLALVAHTRHLATHPPHPGLEAVAVHPGVIRTELLHAMFAIRGDTPARAARTLVAVAQRSGDRGTYYDLDQAAEPNERAADPAFRQRLHELTMARLAAAGIQL